jgi:hypothetical protein
VETSPSLGDVPRGWGDDELTSYLDRLRRGQLGTFANEPSGFRRFIEIDGYFLRLAKNLDNNEHPASANYFYRSHATFRASVAVAAAGQVVETYPLLRACIEHALYAFAMYKDASLVEVWLKRHESPEALKDVKRKFQRRTLIETFGAAHSSDGEILGKLYEHTIDWGAHPNVLGIAQGVEYSQTEEQHEFITNYLDGGSQAHVAALKDVVRIGVIVMRVFCHIFGRRCQLLALDVDLLKAGQGL